MPKLKTHQQHLSAVLALASVVGSQANKRTPTAVVLTVSVGLQAEEDAKRAAEAAAAKAAALAAKKAKAKKK